MDGFLSPRVAGWVGGWVDGKVLGTNREMVSSSERAKGAKGKIQ